jgi:hypothetical protein
MCKEFPTLKMQTILFYKYPKQFMERKKSILLFF